MNLYCELRKVNVKGFDINGCDFVIVFVNYKLVILWKNDILICCCGVFVMLICMGFSFCMLILFVFLVDLYKFNGLFFDF